MASVPRPKLHDERLRERLLEAATVLVATRGEDFALRPLAESLGTSTTAIYSLFGSRAALLDAVAVRAASTLADEMEKVNHPDPMLWILGLGLGFRRFVQHSPDMFQIVFGDPGRSPDVAKARARAQAPLVRAVTAAVNNGFVEGDVPAICRTLFAGVQGFHHLERLGEMGGDQQFFEMVDALFRGYATEKGRQVIAARPELDLDTILPPNLSV